MEEQDPFALPPKNYPVGTRDLLNLAERWEWRAYGCDREGLDLAVADALYAAARGLRDIVTEIEGRVEGCS